MEINRLGIDPSVSTLFPPTVLAERLGDVPVEVVVLDESEFSIADCDGVVTFAHRESFLNLEWVHTVLAGVDRFPHDRFETGGVVLSNSFGVHGDAVGETVAGYVLAFARRLRHHVENQVHREWSQPEWDEAWTVDGERACVVGLGGLGRGVVDRLNGLGLDVDGVRRTPTPEPGVQQVYVPAEFENAVADSRFVILAVPLTEETSGLVDDGIFAAMRDDAYLVNVARGGVVDQDALVEALETGTIAGAALDVFEDEPLPENSPLWGMDEVIVTPHCAGFTRDYCDNVAAIVRESIRRVRDGEDPANRVL